MYRVWVGDLESDWWVYLQMCVDLEDVGGWMGEHRGALDMGDEFVVEKGSVLWR
jgi:hypothetical protein